VSEQLITVDPIEADLTPERIDERLSGGWFPCGQRWMTCRAWPTEDGPLDTVWVRVRLSPRRLPDRWRRLAWEGCTVAFHAEPVLDAEHQRLYERFRGARHPDWTEEAAHLLLGVDAASPLFANTREIAVRDADGRLCAFRWFAQGRTAIAGISSIYDTARSGLGTVARELADQWAARAGYTWSYPGYVWPEAADPWYYKIKHGSTEWLDPEQGRWRAWDGDAPRPEDLVVADMRRRLEQLGDVLYYPGWTAACFDPTKRGLASPYFVVGGMKEDELTVIVWDVHRREYQELRVVVQRDAEASAPEGPPADPPG
jgi:hypothetical protein